MINVFLKQHAKFNMSISTDFLARCYSGKTNEGTPRLVWISRNKWKKVDLPSLLL